MIAAVATHVLEAPTTDATILVGIYHGHAEFVDQALRLAHPFEHHALTDEMRRGLMVRVKCSELAFLSRRRATLAR